MLETIRTGKPTIVLIDELLAGTNSFDRFAGAVALSEFILDRDNALAVLSTHDRNVTRWAERNSDRIGNVHFRDVFDDGEMTFDYQLHAGPALRGNAVELMKRAGLPIPENLPAPAIDQRRVGAGIAAKQVGAIPAGTGPIRDYSGVRISG